MVVVTQVAEDEGVLLLSQLSGKPLFLGMELKEQGGNKSVSFSLSLNRDLDPAFDLLTSWPLPMHPYSVQLGLGATTTNRIYGSAGLRAKLPLSQFFSSQNVLVRNLSLEATALFSAGYDTSIQEIFYQASGELGVACAFSAWTLSLSLGGNRVAASNVSLLEQGLFLKLTTAYTYTL